MLYESIRTKIMTLPEDVALFPGRNNLFVK